MNRAHRKRLRRRHETAAKLTPRAAHQLRLHLMDGWSVAYARRHRVSISDADAFRREKEAELRQLGGNDADIRAFSAACAAQLFAAADRAGSGTPRVPSQLVSNYAVVELFELTEVRRR